MKKILITGASGFIGKNLVNFLSKKNFSLLCLSRKYHKKSNNVKWIKGDFDISKKNFKLIKKFNPSVICHLAWQDIPDFSKNNSKINLEKSKKLVSKISKINSVKKIIISGSCFEYLPTIGVKKENDENTNLINFFSLAKISLYTYLKNICSPLNINFIWLRIFFVYGKHQRNKSLIPYLINCFLQNKKLIINNFSNQNDFIYIDDVINAIYKLIKKQKINSGVYNVGSGQYTSVKKVYMLIKKILKVKKNTKFSKKKNFQRYKASISKIKKEVLWYPKVNIEQGLKKIIFNI